MKPRLLKFTCHSCGARLAVPPEMAGLSDQCPKCGVLVTAPSASPAPSVEIPPAAQPPRVPEPAPVPASAPPPEPAPASAQFAPPQAPQAASPPAPLFSPPKAPEAAPNDAQAQMAALQKRLHAKPPSAAAQEPVVSVTDAQAQVAALQKLLGSKPAPMDSPEPALFPLPTSKKVPEGWSSAALADALKPAPQDVPQPAAPPPSEEVPLAPAPQLAQEKEDAVARRETPPTQDRALTQGPPLPQKTVPASPPIDAGPPASEPVIEPILEAPPAPPAPPAAAETFPPAEAPPAHVSREKEKAQPEAPASPLKNPVLATATSTAPPVPSEAGSSRKPAHEILDSILRRKEPGRPVARAREKPATAKATPRNDEAHALLAHEPRTALVPQHVADAKDAAKAAMPGMGEMLASSALQPMTSAAPESRPLLHVPLVPVLTTAAEQRRARMTHLRNMGIICFLLMDVLLIALAVLYRREIAAWWNGDAAPSAVAVEQANVTPSQASPAVAEAPAPDKPPASTASPIPATESPAPLPPQGGKLPENALAGSASPAAIPLANAAILPPSPGVASALSPEGLTIAPPSESSAASPTAKPVEKAVGSPEIPMAIPLPGKVEESTPDADPLIPLPPGTPQLSPLPKDGSVTSMPPVPPLPDLALPTLGAGALAAAPMPESLSAAPQVASIPSQMPPIITESSTPTVPDAASAPVQPASPPDKGTVEPPKKIGKVPAEAKPALEVLEKFLAAPTWKDRLAYVQKPDIVSAAMEKHAASIGDGPIRAGAIDFLERYPSKAGVPPYCMFEVSGGELKHPVLTLVEQSPKDGTRVDWEAFVDFKDDLLLRFLEKKGSPPQKFRGLLRRKHYFDKDVPDIASKDSFQLVQPNAHFEGHVFVPRSSTVGKQLANQLPWGQDMPVIAELVWKSDAKAWWVQIENIVSYGWRG